MLCEGSGKFMCNRMIVQVNKRSNSNFVLKSGAENCKFGESEKRQYLNI